MTVPSSSMLNIPINKYQGFLIDLDHTLYDYELCHGTAWQGVLQFIQKTLQLPVELIESHLKQARHNVHEQLKNTASSHNRLLYLQGMLELLQVNPLIYAEKFHQYYWDIYFQQLHCRQGVLDFFKTFQDKKLFCLTDFAAYWQYKKLQHLGLSTYFTGIVSSEEVGIEKPSPQIFHWALQKMQLSASCVAMIGDHYQKDIQGAQSLGIDAFHMNFEMWQDSTNNSAGFFTSFPQLTHYLKTGELCVN